MPVDINEGKGMFFTVTGLPSGLSFSNLNPANYATGTLTIAGTPSRADIGVHTVYITAQNGLAFYRPAFSATKAKRSCGLTELCQ